MARALANGLERIIRGGIPEDVEGRCNVPVLYSFNIRRGEPCELASS